MANPDFSPGENSEILFLSAPLLTVRAMRASDAYDAGTTSPGVYAGFNSTARLLFSTGTPATNVEIDNFGGTLRVINPGGVLLTMTPSVTVMSKPLSVPFLNTVLDGTGSATFNGVAVGQVAGSARIFLGNGIPAQTLAIDNLGGTFRFFTAAGVLLAVLDASGLKLKGTVTPNAL